MSQNSISSATSAFSSFSRNDGSVERSIQTTKLDKHVASVSRLHDSSKVLKQGIQVVDEVLTSLDRFLGIKKDVDSLKRLKQSLQIVSKHIEEDAIVLSPIPSMQYVQQRRSVSPDTPTLDQYVNTNCRQSTRQRIRPNKRIRLPEDGEEYEYAAPLNGKVYKPQEVYDIVVATPKRIRRSLIDHLGESNDVPVKGRSIYSLVHEVNNGAAMPTEWPKRGRPPIATHQQVQQEITSTLIDRPGLCLSKEDVAKSLLALRRQSLIDSGIAPIGAVAP